MEVVGARVVDVVEDVVVEAVDELASGSDVEDGEESSDSPPPHDASTSTAPISQIPRRNRMTLPFVACPGPPQRHAAHPTVSPERAVKAPGGSSVPQALRNRSESSSSKAGRICPGRALDRSAVRQDRNQDRHRWLRDSEAPVWHLQGSAAQRQSLSD